MEDIHNRVYVIRGQQVMLDTDLAQIYGYEVKRLNQQVKRNSARFPQDFMFQLEKHEVETLRSQNVTANINNMSRALPFVFTEQGIYMLATVLRGELAEQQSIFIMRAFREMRHCGASSKDAGKKLCAINRFENSKIIHPVIDELLKKEDKII